MKRVAFIFPSLLPFPPVQGGAVETLMDQLLRENGASHHAHDAFKATVFTRYHAEAQARYGEYPHTEFVPIDGFEEEDRIRSLAARALFKLSVRTAPEGAYARRVARCMRGRTFDAVVVENQPGFVEKLAALKVGPIFLHMHNAFQASILPHVERIAPLCHRMIAVSAYIAHDLQNTAGACPAQIRTLLNCVDAKRFDRDAWQSERTRVREMFGITPQEQVFLFTGKICAVKGARELGEAFLRMRHTQAHLLFVGSQWYGETVQDDYQRALATLLAPVRERVHFAGFVPYAQMPAMYAAGDVAVLPSIWEEPSGLTLLEAQASGMPVITTRAGGIPDNVSQESAVLLARGDGLVQALADAMDMLFIDAEMREKMARAGKQFLRGRDIPDYYRAFAALLA